jgi:hypothetical protein
VLIASIVVSPSRNRILSKSYSVNKAENMPRGHFKFFIRNYNILKMNRSGIGFSKILQKWILKKIM